jgi:SNF2 family DNA or RNA helicase
MNTATNTDTDTVSVFDQVIKSRMTRFNMLLERAEFSFKQYQYDGVEWCLRNETAGRKGGFIADEMGLGKTLTMIGLMFVNFLPRSLIVVPAVLIQQWYNEFYKCSGHRPLMYYGTHKKNITDNQLATAPIVLTTYGSILVKNCKITNLHWSRVVFDEAHHLRNSNTSTFKACKKIRANIKWLVSGTPIQNKRKDFYNLCDVAGMPRSFYKDPANLKIIGKNFVLRRTKASVGINLPPVSTNNVVVPWLNTKEKKLSEEIHALMPRQTFVSALNCKRLAAMFGEGGILVAMLRARQSCVMSSLMEKNIHDFIDKGLIPADYEQCTASNSKLSAVIQFILSRKDNGNGKIIFCHYINEIDYIASHLRNGGMSKVITYDGRNSGFTNLAKLADPADAIVLQIQTGCEGLNLQKHFSEIYFVSPHWNPCVEDQAIARCYRIGQTKPVDVFKFEMGGFDKTGSDQIDPITLEKYVNLVQENKRNIINELINNTSGF